MRETFAPRCSSHMFFLTCVVFIKFEAVKGIMFFNCDFIADEQSCFVMTLKQSPQSGKNVVLVT